VSVANASGNILAVAKTAGAAGNALGVGASSSFTVWDGAHLQSGRDFTTVMVWRGDFFTGAKPGLLAVNCSFSSSSNPTHVTCDSTMQLAVGAELVTTSLSGYTLRTKIVSITNATQFVMSANANQTRSGVRMCFAGQYQDGDRMRHPDNNHVFQLQASIWTDLGEPV
jgi:hypothetical protein